MKCCFFVLLQVSVAVAMRVVTRPVGLVRNRGIKLHAIEFASMVVLLCVIPCCNEEDVRRQQKLKFSAGGGSFQPLRSQPEA